MIFQKTVETDWIIKEEDFLEQNIEARIDNAQEADRAFLRSTLKYLYGAIKTLDRERLTTAKPYLTPAEIAVAKWLHTRSNGSERKNYGPESVVAAKAAGYKCNRCKFPDVRTLHLDHTHGRSSDALKAFECLCANCHMIKSREMDWEKPKA